MLPLLRQERDQELFEDAGPERVPLFRSGGPQGLVTHGGEQQPPGLPVNPLRVVEMQRPQHVDN